MPPHPVFLLFFIPLGIRCRSEDFVKPNPRPENWEQLIQGIKLTDGGLYDNLGLQPVWDQYRFLLVSDGGRPARFQHTSRSRLILRYADLLQEQVDNLRRRMLFERNAQAGLDFCACYCGIQNGGVGNGYSSQLTRQIAGIRTDMNAFTPAECRILENHAYHLSDHYLRKYLLQHLQKVHREIDGLKRFRTPHPELMKAHTVKRQLQFSEQRWRPLGMR